MKNPQNSPRKLFKGKLLFLFISSVLIFSSSYGQRYWVSAGGGNWSNAANWSTTSGGPGGAGAPVGMPAIFDGAGGSNGNCNIDIGVSVTGFTITTNYTGTVFQGPNTIMVLGNSSLGGGSFSGGSGIITNTGIFNLAGNNFTSTSSTLSISNNFNFSSGTFNHNNGTVILNNNSLTVNGSPSFYTLKISAASNIVILNNSFSVFGDLILDGTPGVSLDVGINATATITVLGNVNIIGTGYVNVNIGTIAVSGNISITNTHTGGGGTGAFLISGTGNQTLSNTGTIGQGRLPSVTINKPSGVLSLVGIITTIGPNWTYVSGSLNPGTSLVNFSKQSGGANIVINGNHTLYDAIFSSSFGFITINNNLNISRDLTIDGASASNSVNIISSTITVQGTLRITGTQRVWINNGLIDAKGDILSTNIGPAAGGSGTVSLTGTGNQLWSTIGSDGQGSFPNILINKPSGVLSLSGVISSIGPNWTYSAGTIAPGTSTVCLYDDGAPIVVSGTHTLNDFILYPLFSTNTINNNLTVNNMVIDGSSNHNVNITSTVVVNGRLTLNGGSPLRLNTGIIHSKGDILTTNTSNTSGGTATLIINGTVNQNIRGTGIATQSRLPNTVIINKPSGGVFISGGIPFYFYGSVIFTQGLLHSTITQLAYFYSGSSAVGANANSYVNGPVRKRGNTAFTFPVGNGGYYAPIGISAPALVTNVFTAEYFNQNPNPSYNVSLKDPTLNNVSTCEYWILDRTSGVANVSVTPSWDTRSCGVGNMPDLRVARWDGTMWRDHGNGGTTGTLAAGTITTNGVVTSFSPFTLSSATPLNPLPIELISFNGNCNNNSVELHWATATETNNNYFTIERSSDGINWTKLKDIPSQGNSSHQQNYSYTDELPGSNNTLYYRLMQTDKNGDSEQYDMIAVEKCKSLNYESISIYPNPSSSGIFSIKGNKGLSQVNVYDAKGKLVYETSMSESSAEVDISSLATGIYLMKISNNEFNKSIKIIK